MKQHGSASELLGASAYSKGKLLKGFPNFGLRTFHDANYCPECVSS